MVLQVDSHPRHLCPRLTARPACEGYWPVTLPCQPYYWLQQQLHRTCLEKYKEGPLLSAICLPRKLSGHPHQPVPHKRALKQHNKQDQHQSQLQHQLIHPVVCQTRPASRRQPLSCQIKPQRLPIKPPPQLPSLQTKAQGRLARPYPQAPVSQTALHRQLIRLGLPSPRSRMQLLALAAASKKEQQTSPTLFNPQVKGFNVLCPDQ